MRIKKLSIVHLTFGIVGLLLLTAISTYNYTFNPTTRAQSVITPTLYCLGSCPQTAPSENPTTAISGTISPSTAQLSPTSMLSPTTVIPPSTVQPTAAPTSDPCTKSTASTQTKNQNKTHHHRGGFLQFFFRLFILLLELLLRGAGLNPCSIVSPSTGSSTPVPTTPVNQPTSGAAPTATAQQTSGTAPVGSVANPQPTTNPQQNPAPTSGGTSNPVSVGKTVLFTANYNDGTFSQWSTKTECPPKRTVQVVNDYVREGAKAVKFTVSGGDCDNKQRAILTSTNPGVTVKEGDERWYEWSMRIGDMFTFPQGTRNFYNVLEWGDDSDTDPLAILISNDGHIQIGGEGVPHVKKTITNVQKGVWIDYVLHVKFSANANTGFVEAWANGVQTVPKTNRVTFSGSSRSVQIGIDRDDANLDGHDEIWQDNFRITAP